MKTILMTLVLLAGIQSQAKEIPKAFSIDFLAQKLVPLDLKSRNLKTIQMSEPSTPIRMVKAKYVIEKSTITRDANGGLQYDTKTECQGEVEAPVYESGKVIYFERPLIECQSTFLNQPVVVNVIGAMAEGENLTFPGQPITVRKAGFAVGFITSSSFAKWPQFHGNIAIVDQSNKELTFVSYTENSTVCNVDGTNCSVEWNEQYSINFNLID